jgi:predicted GNAT family N-acyltransferase
LYAASQYFRNQILREPLGLKLNEKDLEGEEKQIHIAAIDENEKIVGTVLLKPIGKTLIKLRQMAVIDALQGKGVGKKLILFAESLANSRGYQTIELHARVSAQTFYTKLGYQAEGPVFIEASVPTIRMTKKG